MPLSLSPNDIRLLSDVFERDFTAPYAARHGPPAPSARFFYFCSPWRFFDHLEDSAHPVSAALPYEDDPRWSEEDWEAASADLMTRLLTAPAREGPDCIADHWGRITLPGGCEGAPHRIQLVLLLHWDDEPRRVFAARCLADPSYGGARPPTRINEAWLADLVDGGSGMGLADRLLSVILDAGLAQLAGKAVLLEGDEAHRETLIRELLGGQIPVSILPELASNCLRRNPGPHGGFDFGDESHTSADEADTE